MPNIKISQLPLKIGSSGISTGEMPISINGITYKINPSQLNLFSLTPNSAIISDASGNLSSSLVSATELGYLKGVTGSVQSQINTIVNSSITNIGTGTTNYVTKWKSVSGLTNSMIYDNGTSVFIGNTIGDGSGSIFQVSGTTSINNSGDNRTMIVTNSGGNDNAHFINTSTAGLNSACVYTQVNTNTFNNYCFQANINGSRGQILQGYTETGTDEMLTLFQGGTGTYQHGAVIRVGHRHGVGIQSETDYESDSFYAYHGPDATGNAFRYQFNGTDKAWLNNRGEWTAQRYTLQGGQPSQYLMADGSTTTASATGIGGSGTMNYIPKFEDTVTLGNSSLMDDGTTISTTTPIKVGDTLNSIEIKKDRLTVNMQYQSLPYDIMLPYPANEGDTIGLVSGEQVNGNFLALDGSNSPMTGGLEISTSTATGLTIDAQDNRGIVVTTTTGIPLNLVSNTSNDVLLIQNSGVGNAIRAGQFVVNSGANVIANSFIKLNGQSNQYLMADGSVSSGTTGGAILGSGTTNYIPMFSSPNELQISLMSVAGSRLLIFGPTDNLIDRVQVNGSIIADTIKKRNGTSAQYLMADGSTSTGSTAAPLYKKYVALLSQSGTNAPTATVFENTIGAIVWSRVSNGNYAGTLTGAFAPNKVAVFLTPGIVFSSTANATHRAYRNDNNTIEVITVENGALIDSSLNTASIEIRVYN